MNWYKLFYWMTVADNARSFFVVFAAIFTTIAVIVTLWHLVDDDNREDSSKWIFWSYPFMILFWSLLIFTPNKRDTLLIVAGGGTMNFLTSDSTAKQIPHELSNFVVTELKNMGVEAKVDLGIASQKDRILDEAKKMTTEQLLEKMRVDSNFAKIITDR